MILFTPEAGVVLFPRSVLWENNLATASSLGFSCLNLLDPITPALAGAAAGAGHEGQRHDSTEQQRSCYKAESEPVGAL